ncbi:MAG TPA: response regulator [Gemmatimonadaceae bacterium]|nr:response regulator [Gemmatimonadaceae bacterium]
MSEIDWAARPPLALIVHEEEWSARSLESVLTPAGWAIIRARTGAEALRLVRSAHPTVVLTHVRLPDMKGTELCRRLREDAHAGAGVPLLILANGPVGREERIAAFRNGAWDIFSQPVDSEVLLVRLETFLRVRREFERSQDESLLDAETGVYNLRGLARRAREIGAEALRLRHALACVVLAADTSAGEYASRDEWPDDRRIGSLAERFGRLLARTGRASDVVARIGETEFAIIAPATQADAAERMIERIRSAASEDDGDAGKLRVRAGYCAVDDFASSAADVDELLLRAASVLRFLRAQGTAPQTLAFDQLPVRLPS